MLFWKGYTKLKWRTKIIIRNIIDLKRYCFLYRTKNSEFFKELKKILRRLVVSYNGKCCEDVFISDSVLVNVQ